MYTEHTLMTQPENLDIKVWRYMDFSRLISLLETQCLFFTRLDKFDDHFEGSWSKASIEAREKWYQSGIFKNREEFLAAMEDETYNNKLAIKHFAVNCWHMNDHESAAMWRLYLKSNEGVAIQTTYRKLREAIVDDEEVYLGVIKYINYITDPFDDIDNLFSPVIHKRKSFEHENEVRAIVSRTPIDNEGFIDYQIDTIGNGLNIKININLLIEKIFVAPNSPIWFTELVQSTINRYGYNFEVKNSGLNDDPLY